MRGDEEMDFLRKMISSTRAHLTGLETSQKLAIGLCVVVMGGALIWMFQWSGQAEWVPVLPGQLWSEEELDSAKKILSADQYKVSGRQLLVPASQRQAIRSKLGQSGALPHDTRMGFESLMKETSPWKSQTQQSREWGVAYGNQLAMDLEGWKGVRSAQVILQMPKRRGLGSKAARPSASVSIGLASGSAVDRGFVRAIAHFVGGATGIPPEGVQIVDTNTHKSHRVHGPGSPLGDDLLEVRRQKEQYFQEKIEQLLGISGVRVTVFAELETDRRRETERTPTEGKSIEKRETKEEMTENRKPSATDPGVQPNTSVALSTPGQVEESDTLGALKNLTASINVPRGYLASIFQRQPENEGKTPTDKDIDAISEKEFEKIRKLVLKAIGSVDEKTVAVDWFDGSMIHLAAMGGVPGPIEAGSMTGVFKAYGRQGGLALLAVVSLLMLVIMVRRGPGSALRSRDRHPALAGPQEELDVLSSGVETIGEAAVSETAMEGREVDESTIETEQKVGQVASLVRDDPEMAAKLIQKWIRSP
jgi:flagellar biosynthesis/type III secretory pathway M-ring protein FliF/YscJ